MVFYTVEIMPVRLEDFLNSPVTTHFSVMECLSAWFGGCIYHPQPWNEKESL